MKHTTLKIAGIALAAVISAFTARADIVLNENVSLYGYAAGSFQNVSPNKGNTSTTMDLDAAKIGFAFNFAPITAKMSIFAWQSELCLLEANVTFDIAQVKGLSVTGGRFQSGIGYEAFDIPNQNFITNGADVLDVIPGFNEGVKASYVINEKNAVSLSFVNSIYGNNPFRGNRDLNNGYGIEAGYRFTDGPLKIGATLAYEKEKVGSFSRVSWGTTVVDVWAQYTLKDTTFGAEVLSWSKSRNKDNCNDVFYALVMAKQQLNEKFSVAARFSMGQEKDKVASVSSKTRSFWRFSVQPAYVLTKNLSVGAELNYTSYNKAMSPSNKSDLFFGVQACFKF